MLSSVDCQQIWSEFVIRTEALSLCKIFIFNFTDSSYHDVQLGLSLPL